MSTRLAGAGMKVDVWRCISRWFVAGPDTRLENLGTRQIEFVQQKAPSHTGEEGGRWMRGAEA